MHRKLVAAALLALPAASPAATVLHCELVAQPKNLVYDVTSNEDAAEVSQNGNAPEPSFKARGSFGPDTIAYAHADTQSTTRREDFSINRFTLTMTRRVTTAANEGNKRQVEEQRGQCHQREAAP